MMTRYNLMKPKACALAALLLFACGGGDDTPQANNSAPVVVLENNSTGTNNTTSGNTTPGNMTAGNTAPGNMTTPEDMGMETTPPEEDMGMGEEDMAMQPPREVDRSDFDGNGRPSRVFVPADYDNVREVPLVILLHGYSASGSAQDFYFQLSNEVDRMDFVLLTPDGLVGPQNNRYWNATPACCDFGNSGVDDVAYITGLIDEAIERYNIDEGRIYLMGHSNGGFMSYTTSCRAAERITAMMSLAGTTFDMASDCDPSQPVGILHVHGTLDETILYEGGSLFGEGYPSAEDTAERWASYNGCQDTPNQEAARSLLATGGGDETEVYTYPGCPDGGGVSLWKIEGGSHIPGMKRGWVRGPLEHLFAYDRTP